MSKFTSDKRMLEYELNMSYSNIFCFSTTRHGGVSKDNYSSFNCNEFCGDNIDDVTENRKILSKLLPQKPRMLVFPHQNHGTKLVCIDEKIVTLDTLSRKNLLEGVDAIVTDIPDVCLCISTADCIPVLLFDDKKKVAAAVHAGWRGTVNRIVRKCISYMIEQFGSNPADIHACIGPGISLDSFEVGNEVYNEFADKGFDMEQISKQYVESGKWHIDLPEANKIEMLNCGLKQTNIECSDICTYKNNEVFFSARRQGIASGRIISGIMLLR